MIESQGESPQLQGMLLHLRLQESPSSVAPTTSEPAMAASSAISPAGTEHLPNYVANLAPESTEAPLMSTAWVYMYSRTAGRPTPFKTLLALLATTGSSEWPPCEYKWVDPLTLCNSAPEYDTDIEGDAAAYCPDVDDGTW